VPVLTVKLLFLCATYRQNYAGVKNSDDGKTVVGAKERGGKPDEFFAFTACRQKALLLYYNLHEIEDAIAAVLQGAQS